MSSKKVDAVEEEKPVVLLSNQIIAAEGTSHERVVTVVNPRGKSARRKMAKHFPKIAVLQSMAELDDNGKPTAPSLLKMAGAIETLYTDGGKSFEEELMPMLVGMENDPEGLMWLLGDDNGNLGLGIMEMFALFTQASMKVLSPDETETLEAVQKK